TEYVRTTYKTNLSYTWQLPNSVQYTVKALELGRIATELSADFEDFLAEERLDGSTFPLLFDPAIFTTIGIQRNKSSRQYQDGGEGFFLLTQFDLGGDPNRLFGDDFFGEGLETYQFSRANFDYREIIRLRRKLNMAFRFNVGLAYPYGSNAALPNRYYFFLGGSNSVRAWRPNRLGPGAFGVADVEEVTLSDQTVQQRRTGRTDETVENPGELMLQGSLEFRQKINSFVETAVFLDLGNVWLLRGDLVNPEDDADAEFDENGNLLRAGDDGLFRVENFFKEIAVGTGFGFRFDLQFLIFRLDLGLRVFDPAQPLQNRFVLDRLTDDFGYVSQVNIGIGYPF
ncbi:MAG: BamA/TamA family outer membrane protein, partial [Bacteroidota bacterium]